MKRKVKVHSYSLSDEAAGKLDECSSKLHRSASQTLERLLMSMSYNVMIRHASRSPIYGDGADNDTTGETARV